MSYAETDVLPRPPPPLGGRCEVECAGEPPSLPLRLLLRLLGPPPPLAPLPLTLLPPELFAGDGPRRDAADENAEAADEEEAADDEEDKETEDAPAQEAVPAAAVAAAAYASAAANGLFPVIC